MSEKIAIVGGGIIGCLIARELLKSSPEAQISLIERDLVGQGASLRSAGLHFPLGRTDRVRRMSAYSQRFYSSLQHQDPSIPIYDVKLSVLAPQDGFEGLRVNFLAEATLAHRAINPNEEVRVPGGFGAWDVVGCQYADVHGLVQHLARSLRKKVEFLEGTEVRELTSSALGARLALSTGDTLNVDRVVLAPGPWLNAPAWRELLKPLGARVKKIVAMHLNRAPAETDRATLFLLEDAFLLPVRSRGHWLYSFTCQEWDVEPDEIATSISERHVAEARSILENYAPSLAEMRFSGRVFCDAYSINGEPEVRVVDEHQRILFAGTGNGSGYRLAPAIASQTVKLLSQQTLGVPQS